VSETRCERPLKGVTGLEDSRAGATHRRHRTPRQCLASGTFLRARWKENPLMKKQISIALAAFSLLALAAAPALADDTAKDAKDAKTTAAAPKDDKDASKTAVPAKDAKSKDYGYTFEDDPLASNVQGTTGFVLKLRPPSARQLLLRPRVSFVPEMLKSVEGL
jgi:hypothetical protein